jgi:hypothetical protein
MLANKCKSRRTRTAIFSFDQPTDWKPTSLKDPRDPKRYFTEDSAWEFISELLDGGCDLTTVTLDKPAGKRGYVIKISGVDPVTHIYIKIQLGADKVYGRSFHESYDNPAQSKGTK